MAHPLYATSPNANDVDLHTWTSSEIDWLIYNLQLRYAAQLNANGRGRVFVSGSSQNAGSAQDTRRTSRSSASSFPGTGSQTISTRYFGQDRGSDATVNNTLAYLHYSLNGTGIDFSRATQANSLVSEIFNQAKTNMQTGNEIGSYRIDPSSPGTGWANKGVVFTDTVYNGTYAQPSSIANVNYTLWLKTSAPSNQVVSAPTNTRVVTWDGARMQEIGVGLNSTFMSNFLLPHFTNWAASNLTYNMSTSTAGAAKGGVLDTRRSITRNIRFHTDSYVSYPSGGVNSFRTYYWRLS